MVLGGLGLAAIGVALGSVAKRVNGSKGRWEKVYGSY